MALSMLWPPAALPMVAYKRLRISHPSGDSGIAFDSGRQLRSLWSLTSGYEYLTFGRQWYYICYSDVFIPTIPTPFNTSSKYNLFLCVGITYSVGWHPFHGLTPAAVLYHRYTVPYGMLRYRGLTLIPWVDTHSAGYYPRLGSCHR